MNAKCFPLCDKLPYGFYVLFDSVQTFLDPAPDTNAQWMVLTLDGVVSSCVHSSSIFLVPGYLCVCIKYRDI